MPDQTGHTPRPEITHSEAAQIVAGYRADALDALKRVSELHLYAERSNNDADLRQALLACENAAGRIRHYIYVRNSARERMASTADPRVLEMKGA
ncbi:MAG: hypothetical protein AB1824_01380 [Acidobacteriota bacterium]